MICRFYSRCPHQIPCQILKRIIPFPSCSRQSQSRLLGTSQSRAYHDDDRISDEVFIRAFKKIKDSYKGPESFKDYYDSFAGECKKWREEIRDRYHLNNRLYDPYRKKGEIDILFKFDNEEDLEKFSVVTDSTLNAGYSSASVELTKDKTALVQGHISSQVPKDGENTYAGYVALLGERCTKSFNRPGFYDWLSYTHIVLKVRGDGRTWGVILSTPGRYKEFKHDKFTHPLYTRGGPYWQVTKIPFSHFVSTRDSQISETAGYDPIPLNKVSRFTLALPDGIDGPYRLEIDYVGLEFQKGHRAVSPYETYYTGQRSSVR